MIARAARALALAALAGAAAPAQDFAALYRRAEDLRLQGDANAAEVRSAYAAAVHSFVALSADAPGRAASLPAAAFAALQAGEPARAARWIEESLALGADDAWHAGLHVRALALAGEARAAVAAVHRAHARHPEAVRAAVAEVRAAAAGALCEAADVALREGRTDEGLLTFTLLVEVSGRQPTALANCALALRHVGREAEAEALYREAIAAAPEDPELWNDLGLLLKGQGRDAEAVDAFARSLALDRDRPPSGPAISNLVAMARAGRVRDAAAGIADPVGALSGVLARVPSAAMARRLLLAELLDRPFPPDRADTRAPLR
ncbi:MAG TPA: tetratricopeptide repeat protein [Planctomycetota bacterium]|nr:tetratricopeptide repeat protein [Planctomycetota bacterium]